MKSLTQAMHEASLIFKDNEPRSKQVRAAQVDVVLAASRHVKGSHITTTYSDGSSGKKEVVWHPDEQRFVDWGNNFWLYGPDSYWGQEKGGTWILSARHSDGPIVEAILDKANSHLSCPSRLQMMWRSYWQLLLMETLRYSGDAIVDLHLTPLDVESLAPRPTIFGSPFHRSHRNISSPRKADYILV